MKQQKRGDGSGTGTFLSLLPFQTENSRRYAEVRVSVYFVKRL